MPRGTPGSTPPCKAPGCDKPARKHGYCVKHRNARKTHCPQGHPYDEEKRYGQRICSECRGGRKEG